MPRRLAGFLLLIAAARPLFDGASTLYTMFSSGDFSGMDAAGALLLGVIFFMVAVMLAIGAAGALAGVLYLRGRTDRTLGLAAVAPMGLLAVFGVSETAAAGGLDLAGWIGYTVICVVAVLFLLLPARTSNVSAA